MNNAPFPGKTPKNTPLRGKIAGFGKRFFRNAHGRARQTALSGGCRPRRLDVGDGVLDVPSARRCRAGNGLPRRCAPRSKCPWGTPRNDRMRGGGVSGSKKSKPRRGLLPLFRTACPAPLPARRWHHPGSRAGDARRVCSAPAVWRWPGHSPPPPM